MKPIDPPSKHYVDFAHLEKAAKLRYTNLRIQRRKTLEEAYDFGLLLRQCREVCKVGDWTPFLERIGLNRNAATEYLRIADLDNDAVMECESITEALAAVAKQKAAEPAREKEIILCEACSENGPAADCPECEKTRKRATKSRNRTTGQVDFDWREYHTAYGKMVQLSDRLAHALGVLNTPVIEGWQRRLEELRQEMRAAWEKRKKEEAPKY